MFNVGRHSSETSPEKLEGTLIVSGSNCSGVSLLTSAATVGKPTAPLYRHDSDTVFHPFDVSPDLFYKDVSQVENYWYTSIADPGLFARIEMPLTLGHLAYVCIGAASIWFFIHLCIFLESCNPIYYNWRQPTVTLGIRPAGHCLNLKSYKIAMAAAGLVLDGVIFSLPHFVVWRLQLRKAHKIAMSSVFALGVLNIIVATARIINFVRLPFNTDLTYEVAEAIIWANAQQSTAIIVTCCPLLRPLYDKLVGRRLTRINTTPIRRATPLRLRPIRAQPTAPTQPQAQPLASIGLSTLPPPYLHPLSERLVPRPPMGPVTRTRASHTPPHTPIPPRTPSPIPLPSKNPTTFSKRRRSYLHRGSESILDSGPITRNGSLTQPDYAATPPFPTRTSTPTSRRPLLSNLRDKT